MCRVQTLSENPWNSTDIQAHRKTCTMKRLYCVVFIIVLISHVCAATEKKPSIGRARYLIPNDFTNNNGRFEYEITTVERVNRNGQRYSPHRHFMNYGQNSLRTGPLYYRLAAFGRSFNLRLERDHSFVSPLLTVEHVFSDAQRLPFAGDLRHCFYRGDLQGDPNSTAVFNLCNGLRGSFVSSNERYFVEPVDEQKTNVSTNFRKFHIVFRRPIERKDDLSNGSTCGVKDTDIHLSLLRGRLTHHANNSKGARRRRRSIDESFVETLVVADRTMVDAFGSKADLQSYILTLMGVVSQVYRDRSIGNPINIVVVKIAFLETNEPGIHISSEASRTLKSFCRWQKKVMAKHQQHPEHHDTAILLTKRNICRSPGKCDTLGLAELGTMCNPSRSCSLAEDSGLSTAYTIAHELGHVFNLPHDGDNNPCTRSRGDQHLMARSLSFDNKPWSWSNCSRDKLTNFLDLGYGSCLADKPGEKEEFRYKDRLPGELYSIDKQCQMVFGENSSLCPFMEPCRRLWCVKMIGRRRGCSTHHMPWADGTPCAKRKWCIRGQCVKKRRLKPGDGHWGQWGPYMECTRKCGGGISFSYRKCNNPMPENGGKYCIGPRKRFKSCNTNNCPKGSVDFRALQCVNTYAHARTGYTRYRITQWVPKYAGVSKENQCKLYCRKAGTAIYFKLKDKVIDGTPCNRETTDICVDGKCMPAGCDRVLNSNKKTDKCGVCDGDNSSCRRFSGTFNETRFGYNYIFTIPVESTDIVITQYGWKNGEDDNFLALQSDSGRFLLNGGMVIGLGVREFRAAGSKIWYSGSEKPIEQIKIDGKTTEPIKVHVLEVGEELPPNVHYSLNQKVAEPKKFVYKWDHLGPWTQCSKLCQGQRKRRPRCVRAIDGQLVSNSRCDQRTRPSSVTEDCNISCRLRWQIQNSGKCSARCGPGYQTRQVRCIRVIDGHFGEVQDKHCPTNTMPSVVIPCTGSCEGTRWLYTEWSKCSKSCNGGKQFRRAECVDKSGESLKERDCRPSDKQTLRRPCNTFICPWWTNGTWSSCSVTCGSGQQTRLVKCIAEQGPVRKALCNQRKKPEATKSCDLESCPYWFVGKWTDCSQSCDNGTRTRQVMCLSGGKIAKQANDAQCSAANRPQSQEVCKKQDCVTRLYPVPNLQEGDVKVDYYWRINTWTPCSVSCGEKPGTQYRDVECVLVQSEQQVLVDEHHCGYTSKPAVMMECSVSPCTTWRHGSWGRCSRRCGKGVHLRVVKCTYDNFKITDDKNCDLSSKPLNIRACQIRPCVPTKRVPVNYKTTTRARPTTTSAPTTSRLVPSWREGGWSQCSVTCGQGQRTREVHCRSNDGRTSNDCDEKTKPQSVMDCVLRACPSWRVDSWSECSVSCGLGVRQRNVDCRFRNGQRSRGCNEKDKPVTNEACTIRQCPVWMAGDWGRCSVTCGSGVKQRSVECSGKDFSCDARTKPETTAPCNLEPCPLWTTGSWEECSVSCGEGIRQRKVNCKLQNGQLSPGCDEENKPAATEVCNIRPCPIWMAGSWGRCSVTCGVGVKQRSVECSDKDFSCEASTKPQTTAPCNLEPCPQWTTGPWRECSVSCGEGIRIRDVNCRLQNGQLSLGCNEENKPVTEGVCNTRPCPTWMTGDWGKCSATCGSGVKQRSVECSDKDFSCEARTKPQTTAPCNLEPCPQWTTGSWGECSVSCGEGIRQRSITCRLRNGQRSLDCNEEIKPAANEGCNNRPCPRWMTGDWGKCSVTCGSGVKQRSVECSDKDFNCEAPTKPQTTAPCNLETCPQWITGRWGECSVSCGDGVRERSVNCKLTNGQLSPGCSQRNKPAIKEACNIRSCPTWLAGDWGRCSVTCGLGVKQRSVECSDKDFSCEASTKPQTTAACNLEPCPQWTTGRWGECSKTCGNGIKTRAVDCNGFNSQCDVKTKPVNRAVCNLGPCAEWKVGDWQQCSVSCGRGWRRRTVKCTVRNYRCDYRSKPDVYSICNMGSCPVWRTGRWSECSVTCGNGVRTRTVECTGGKGNCNNRTQPHSTARCYLGSCPEWNVGTWSQCSVSCGNGTKTRTVKCSGVGKCDVSSQPQSSATCNLGFCPEWNVKEWSQCSVTCGDGIKQREVNCSRSDVRCDSRRKPQATSHCNLGLCPKWRVGEWGQCSVTCGDGTRQREVNCSRSDVRCDSRRKPQATSHCNLGLCPEWRVGEWGQCSVTCGDGTRQREVNCSRSDVRCDSRRKPQATSHCNLGLCPEWRVGEWGQCSVTCGDGTRQREVKCSRSDVRCESGSKPHVTSHCNLGSCPEWKVGEWGLCSVTCGDGFRRRTVWCSGGVSNCDFRSKPETVSPCNPGSCPEWRTDEWSKCSVTCGIGVKQRAISCSRSDVACDVEIKPASTAKCVLGACPVWELGDWSQCSVTCGGGLKTRTVQCSGGSNKCDPKTKPATTANCNRSSCPQWIAAPWSECSASCGEGVKERLVECRGETGESSACDPETKPAERANCNLGQCPHWNIGEWAECSVTCGSGIKQRNVHCVSGVNASCDGKSRPIVTAKCNLGLCPRWNTGRWTQCSRTCGSGTKRRAVGCFSMITRKRVQDSACDEKLRPAGQEDCIVRACVPQARWRKGEWSKCSVYCGIGDKTRDVWCSTKNGARVPDEYCASERKPRTQRSCNKKRRCGEWEIGLWSECSETCGEGTKDRAIRCLHALEYKSDTFCDHNTRPSDQQPCNKRRCPALHNQYQWQTSIWTECSSSCGYGQISRDIWCADLSGRKVSDTLCNPASRPENASACYGSKCPAKWKHGDWSVCSRTCARGYQYRIVECVGGTECDKRTKPPVWRPCNMGQCGGFLFWRVGPWSQCSVTCGQGIMRRAVKCLARNGTYLDDEYCTTPSSSKPDPSRVCQMDACPPTTCKDVQVISGLQADGEQTLMIQGKELQVYCHAMMTEEPKEYITLKTGPADNFAEIYPKRLRNAWSCPFNGSHFEECDCEDEDYKMSGGSYFRKVRLDLSSMRIIAEDKTFASTRGLDPPPYGTAGDCYSAQGNCPQGRFSINLKETGISLISKVMWGSTGLAYSQIIYRYPEGLQVIGKCGGRCGTCSPKEDVGLQVQLVQDAT